MARPEHPVLIVDRRADSVALFLSIPAEELRPAFGSGAENLLGPDGTIDIDRLYDGTFSLADEIFAQVRIRADERPVTFEAMSMMVHDPEALPAFETPWDGETAIAVCTSPDTVDQLGLETLQAYLGFYAWRLNGLAELSLTLPNEGRAVEQIEVREFWNMQPLDARIVAPDDAGRLVLKPTSAGPIHPTTLWLLALAFGALGAVFLVSHRKADRRGNSLSG